tara:strand:- start:234 stop:995 length:762 start_codon:yes stop_codon:yes gene_type:complete
MKSLLINVGFGWSATTPLFRTLVKNEYCKKFHRDNGGYGKECHLLQGIRDGKNTIEEYIDYHNSIEGERVYDFSNTNDALPSEFIDTIAPILHKHFDVKVTMIVRDPVRRFYSMCVHNYRKDILGIHQNDYTGDRTSDAVIPYFRSMLSKAKYSYVQTYKTYSKHFPTYVIIMEKLWENEKEELSKLSSFLEFPITELFPNVYHDGILHHKLKDQWTDDIPLNQLDYRLARNRMSWIYDEWEKEFDNMPWSTT